MSAVEEVTIAARRRLAPAHRPPPVAVPRRPAGTAFKPLVREHKFDLSELAIVTFLQAKAYGKPYVLLPAVVVARPQHHTLAYNPERGALKPSDLNGRTLGVRAYTQTTGMWVRAALAEDYGLPIERMRWVTQDPAHVEEIVFQALAAFKEAGA